MLNLLIFYAYFLNLNSGYIMLVCFIVLCCSFGLVQSNSNSIDMNCPKIYLITTGHIPFGFGDQMERYTYGRYMSYLLKLPYIVDGFRDQPSHHSQIGSSSYDTVATLLGIEISNKTAIKYQYNITNEIYLTYKQIFKYSRNISVDDKYFIPCHRFVVSSIDNCQGWCTMRTGYRALEQTRPILFSQHNAYDTCYKMNLGYVNKNTSVVDNIWHIRVGDICLNCGNLHYFRTVYSDIQSMLSFRNTTIRLTFESQDESRLGFLRKEFSFAEFSHTSLLEVVCKFITCDILITSGSSLPAVVAYFTKPWHPIVFEEFKKYTKWANNATQKLHHFKSEDAILLHDGIFVEDKVFVQTLFREKISILKNWH
jgi:hypothetical protein